MTRKPIVRHQFHLDLKKTMDYYFYLHYTVHQYPSHSVLEHGPHGHSGIGGGWMRWMATDLSQEYYYKVTTLKSFIRGNKIRKSDIHSS